MTDKKKALLALLVALVLPQLAGGIGAVATASSVNTWYRGLKKPPWNPPGWLFGPVWTVLYLLMGVASWMVWQRGPAGEKRQALGLYGGQLGLNALWSLIFFGARRLDWALVEIAALWAAILATLVRFYRLQPAAGLLLVPYQAWTSFAAVLNAAVWRLNRREGAR